MCYDNIAGSLTHYTCVSGVISRGTRANAVPIVEKLSDRMEMAFPLLKCWSTAKMHYRFYGICMSNLEKVPGVIPPDTRKRPDACTRTPISAWLVCVPTDPVSRNDHWCGSIANGEISLGRVISRHWRHFSAERLIQCQSKRNVLTGGDH